MRPRMPDAAFETSKTQVASGDQSENAKVKDQDLSEPMAIAWP